MNVITFSFYFYCSKSTFIFVAFIVLLILWFFFTMSFYFVIGRVECTMFDKLDFEIIWYYLQKEALYLY